MDIDATKTPRTHAAWKKAYDVQELAKFMVELSQQLEVELNTAIVNEAFAENKTYTLEKQLKQANERINRLEEMYEGEIGENEQFLGSNLKGLLIREINECNKIIRQQQLLDEENLMLKNRIKQLEVALEATAMIIGPPGHSEWATDDEINRAWGLYIQTKEAKL